MNHYKNITAKYCMTSSHNVCDYFMSQAAVVQLFPVLFSWPYYTDLFAKAGTSGKNM